MSARVLRWVSAHQGVRSSCTERIEHSKKTSPRVQHPNKHCRAEPTTNDPQHPGSLYSEEHGPCWPLGWALIIKATELAVTSRVRCKNGVPACTLRELHSVHASHAPALPVRSLSPRNEIKIGR